MVDLSKLSIPILYRNLKNIFHASGSSLVILLNQKIFCEFNLDLTQGKLMPPFSMYAIAVLYYY